MSKPTPFVVACAISSWASPRTEDNGEDGKVLSNAKLMRGVLRMGYGIHLFFSTAPSVVGDLHTGRGML